MTASSAIKNPILVRERRSALIQAAIEVFSEKGYHASRVSDVAQRAGLSQGTVYNYVGSKEDLLYLVCEDFAFGYEETVGGVIKSTEDPVERLHALIRATIDVVFTYRTHFLVLQRELHCVDKDRRKPFLRHAAQKRKMIEDVVLEAAKAEGVIVSNSLVKANILIYLPGVIISKAWDLRGKVSDRVVAEELMAFMLKGLGFSTPYNS